MSQKLFSVLFISSAALLLGFSANAEEQNVFNQIDDLKKDSRYEMTAAMNTGNEGSSGYMHYSFESDAKIVDCFLFTNSARNYCSEYKKK